MAAYAALVTDLCSRAYPTLTDYQLSLAVDHFISGIADTSFRDYLMRERARRPLEWQEAVRIAQASEAAHLSEPVHSNAATMLPRASSNSDGAIASTIAVNTAPRGNARDWPKENAHSPRSRQPRTDRDSEKQSRPLPKQEYSNSRDQATPGNPPPNEKTSGAMATSKPDLDSNRDKTKSNFVICFKCGKQRHITSSCRSDSKPPRCCYNCGGIGHRSELLFAKVYPAPTEPDSEILERSRIRRNRSPQLLTEAVIEGVRVHDALVDTKSAFSMVSESLYLKLPNRSPIQCFKKPASDIVCVGGASAEVKGNIDVPLQIAGVEVAHPLLVVSGLAFQILIGMDVYVLIRPRCYSVSRCHFS